jgi:hypothetical protein
VLYVTSDDKVFDQQSALALNVVRAKLMHLSLAAFKTMVRQQAFVVHLQRDTAVQALASMVPEKGKRTALLSQVNAIVSAGGDVTAEQGRRLVRLSAFLAITPAKPAAPLVPRRTLPMAKIEDAGKRRHRA